MMEMSTKSAVVTLPLAGRVREGGVWPGYRGSQHPLPTSPVKGEVPPGECERIEVEGVAQKIDRGTQS
jgi:hypothetical protein